MKIMTEKKGKTHFAWLDGKRDQTTVSGDSYCYVLGNLICVLANAKLGGISIQNPHEAQLKPEPKATKDFELLSIPRMSTRYR